MSDSTYSTRTGSLCPECLRAIPASRVREGDTVYLEKRCPEHGHFRTPVWRGEPAFDTWFRPKTPSFPDKHHQPSSRGCPFDCGLCPGHGQHTCTALLEVTSRCDLRCPVCFAGAGDAPAQDPPLSRISFWFDQVLAASGTCNIQLSGGEPTMRDDLPDIVALGRRKGFAFIQLNTNGLRLASDEPYARKLKEAGLSSVFLQFDGTNDAIYRQLRGAELLDAKRRAVERCRALGIGVVLVPTVVPGINAEDLGNIVAFALAAGPTVRGVHFQPISYFGRYGRDPEDGGRITLPEIMRGLQSQTKGLLRVTDFLPPGCEHALCSFHGNYLRLPGGGLRPVTGTSGDCCTSSHKQPLQRSPAAKEGADKAKAFVAKQWAAPTTLQTPGDAPGGEEQGDFDRFIEQARTGLFSVSAMCFQDAWTLDLERLQGCCIHCVSPDGRLIPFCAYNLTSALGQALHRGRTCPP